MIKRLLSSLLVGLSLVSVGSANSGPYEVKRYFKNNGGLIDHISALLVPEDKASGILNFNVDDRGQLTGRPGFHIITTTGALAGTTTAITGGGYHNAASGSSFFAVVAGTNVYRTGNTFNGNYTNVTGTVAVTSSYSNLAQHTALNDTIIFCNETDPPFKLGSTGNAFALVGAPTKAHTCATYGNYLILANTTEASVDFPSRIRWSDINNPDSFPVLNFIDLEPNDGDKIISIVTFKDSVYVFKKRSIYRLMITGLDGPDAFIVRPFSRNIGCWAKNSVRVIPNLGIAFLAQNTLYVLGDNELSAYNYSQLDAAGDPIQRTFDGISRTQWGNAVGAVYPKRYQYWLSVADTGTSTNKVLVFDYAQKAWTVYSGSFSMLEQAEDSNGRNLLIEGDYTGNLYQHDVDTTEDKFANLQTPIDTSYTTGWLTQDEPEYSKGYKYLYIFTQASSTATLTAEAAFDYGTDFEFSETVGLGPQTALYDVAIYDTDIYAALGYQVNRFELDRTARAVQIRFSSSSTATSINVVGFALVYSKEDWK